ncbi:MAG: hypothetical protein IT342_01095 [Candidatus Melainabacteria bacterium]|nr:hypothetical protein [Candidatus Melainabacteria bacterium]
MPSFDSPEPSPQAQTQDIGFAQAAFEELQYAYRKDPANCARMYRDLKSEADNNISNDEERADSCQKLCLLDLAVANIKANAGDNKEASVMFNDAALYLDKLKSLPGGSTTQEINDIARKVKCKI